MPVSEIAVPIALAVLRVAVVAAVGFLLARRGVLHSAALADLSVVVIRVAAPCLIFANAANGFTGFSAASSLAALAASPLLLGFGWLSGLALCRVAGVKEEHRRAVVAASTFQNSAYLPIAVASSVLPSLAGLFPAGAATASAAVSANGLVAISLFGVLYSPLFWGLGLWWITEGHLDKAQNRSLWVVRLFPPAVIGVLLGYLVGLTPLHLLLTPSDAPVHFVFQSISDVGSLTIPLANLILGGMLSLSFTNRIAEARDAVCAVGAKLILTPALTLLLLWGCRDWWKGNAALSLVAFIVLLQAACPPATNLAVMTKGVSGAVESRTPLVMPGLLLAAYPAGTRADASVDAGLLLCAGALT